MKECPGRGNCEIVKGNDRDLRTRRNRLNSGRGNEGCVSCIDGLLKRRREGGRKKEGSRRTNPKVADRRKGKKMSERRRRGGGSRRSKLGRFGGRRPENKPRTGK